MRKLGKGQLGGKLIQGKEKGVLILCRGKHSQEGEGVTVQFIGEVCRGFVRLCKILAFGFLLSISKTNHIPLKLKQNVRMLGKAFSTKKYWR